MERTADIPLPAWRTEAAPFAVRRPASVKAFTTIVITCACASALLASWLPLQLSIVTLFLFAGPHNWFEMRYFLMRLPVRFGRSRNFFVTAFVGIGVLTTAYLALPLLYNFSRWSDEAWSNILASWNTLLLIWLGLLIWLRGKQKPARLRDGTAIVPGSRRDWAWAIPIVFGLSSLNWLAPEFFSLAIVYLHPLVALWFLDRHLRRVRPGWLSAYHRCLWLLPLLLVGIVWQLGRTPALPDDNGLFWRITQHSGSQLLPGLSSHLLVSVHLFLEMLHYGVWIIALPLIAPAISERPTSIPRYARIWDLKSVPVARHGRGFPKLVAALLAFGLFLVLILWVGFSLNYSTTRDLYFTIAIAHVLAEAPFLLRMI